MSECLFRCQATWIEEMSGGLFDNEQRSRKDKKDEADDKHISINPPVTREKKKTRKEKAAEALVCGATVSLS